MSEMKTQTETQMSQTFPEKSSAIHAVRDLTRQVQNVAHTAIHRVRRRALMLTATLTLATLLVCAMGDWIWKPVEWYRWVGFGCILGMTLICLARLLYPAFQTRLTLIDAAQRLEQADSKLGDRLSSVLALSRSSGRAEQGREGKSDHHFSREMLQIASVEVTDSLADYDFTSALRPDPYRKRGLALAIVCCCWVAGMIAWPSELGLAVHRLMTPWQALAWPQVHHLEMDSLPPVVQAGSRLILSVTDPQNRLPDDLRVLARILKTGNERDNWTDIPLPAVQAAASKTLMDQRSLASRPPVAKVSFDVPLNAQQIAVRAIGGDDSSMAWKESRIVAPPRLVNARFRVHPPSYTGLPAYETSAATLRVLSGSRLQFDAAVDRPLLSAKWSSEHSQNTSRLDTAKPTPYQHDQAKDKSAEPTPAFKGLKPNLFNGQSAKAHYSVAPLGLAESDRMLEIDPTGLKLRSKWIAGKANTPLPLRIFWTDQHRVSGQSTEAWILHVDGDRPPRAQWSERPRPMDVTDSAKIPLRWQIEDDFGIRQSWVEIQWSASAAEPPFDPVPHVLFRNKPPRSTESPTRQQSRQETLVLSDLEGVPSGSDLTVTSVAVDALGQQGRSRPLHLRWHNAGQLRSLIAEQATEWLHKVHELGHLQRLAAERTYQIRDRLQDPDESIASIGDWLQVATSAQQKRSRQILGGPEPLLDAIDDLLHGATLNRMNAQTTHALQEASKTLRRVHDSAFQPASTALRAATAPKDRQAIAKRLAEAAKLQDSAGETLERLAQKLAAQLQIHAVAQQIDTIAEMQQRIASATEQLQEASDSIAERRRWIDQQRRLARLTDQLQGQLNRLAQSDQPFARQRSGFHQAQKTLQNQQISMRMREVARWLEQRRDAESTAQQNKILNDLADVADTVHGAVREQESIRNLTSTLRQAQEIVQHQQAIVDQIARIRTLRKWSDDRLARKQFQIAQQTRRFGTSVIEIPLFREAVDAAHREMLSVANRLQRSSQVPELLDKAKSVLQRMQDMTTAIEAMESVSSGGNNRANSGSPEGSAGQPSKRLPIATLLLMRMMQQRLHDQTVAMAATDEQTLQGVESLKFKRKRDWLASEQRQLMQYLDKIVHVMATSDSVSAPDLDSDPKTNR